MKSLAILLLSVTSLFAFPSMDASHWINHGNYPWTYFYNNPAGGFQFDFPQSEPGYGYGTVGYILQWSPEPLTFTPAAISMTFRVESSPDVEYVSVDLPAALSARFRLIFMSSYQIGCPLDAPTVIPCEFNSWWSRDPADYILGSADGKTFTIRVPLQPELWSSVFGRPGNDSDGWFDVSKANILQVGFTFGGVFYGHGVRLNAGSSTVKVLDYQLIPKESAGMP